MRRSWQEICEQNDELRKLNRMKREFLATVSHEIRTPMNGIVGMTGLLLESTLTDEQRNDAETIRTSALYLLELVNDLLDLSRLEAGKLSLDAAPFDLRACLESIPLLLAPHAESKQLAVTLSWPESMPRMWVGNAGRIRQIVLNFAANAVKFTPSPLANDLNGIRPWS